MTKPRAYETATVERGFCGNGGVIVHEAQRVIRDGDAEVFGNLAAIEQGADGAADLVGPA